MAAYDLLIIGTSSWALSAYVDNRLIQPIRRLVKRPNRPVRISYAGEAYARTLALRRISKFTQSVENELGNTVKAETLESSRLHEIRLEAAEVKRFHENLPLSKENATFRAIWWMAGAIISAIPLGLGLSSSLSFSPFLILTIILLSGLLFSAFVFGVLLGVVVQYAWYRHVERKLGVASLEDSVIGILESYSRSMAFVLE